MSPDREQRARGGLIDFEFDPAPLYEMPTADINLRGQMRQDIIAARVDQRLSQQATPAATYHVQPGEGGRQHRWGRAVAAEQHVPQPPQTR
eukprot:5489789-Pyramimonas_sp.AAC.1